MNKYQGAFYEIITALKKDDLYMGDSSYDFIDKDDITLIQELVYKATPKKIINHWECPNCGHGYETHNGEYGDNFNYCGNCGQHLDWSEDEQSR